MEITYIWNHKDQWIFEYPTASEQAEIRVFAERLVDSRGAEFREINGPVVELQSTVE